MELVRDVLDNPEADSCDSWRVVRNVPLTDPTAKRDKRSELKVYLRTDEIDGLAGSGVVDESARIEP